MVHYYSLIKSCCLVTKSCPTLCPHGMWPAKLLLCPWDFPGQNTGVGCCFLLQGIFLTQGLNLSLLHWQADSFSLSHQGNSYQVLVPCLNLCLPRAFMEEFMTLCVCVCVLVAQPCLTLCSPMDCSPPGSSVHGILQARILE